MVSNAQRVISGCIRSYITYKVGCRSIVFYFMQKILFDFHNFDAMAIFNWINLNLLPLCKSLVLL